VVRRATTELDIIDEDGYRTGDSVFVCCPRSLPVVGSLDQFVRASEPKHLVSPTLAGLQGRFGHSIIGDLEG
jgi:hypothetical protein